MQFPKPIPKYLNKLIFGILHLIIVIVILLPEKLQAQEPSTSKNKYTISGYLEDAQSGEKLIGATVYDPKSSLGAVSNVYGFYSLTLPADSIYLIVSYIGYQKQIYKLFLDKNISLDISLSEEVEQEAVVITAEENSERIEEKVQMSQITIPIEQIKKLPAFLGEVDVLKVLQLLPGVQSGSEGSSGFYVRGGSPDQNLILLDGVPVYNAFHLFGFFSVFNADAIKNVTLTKGGYPARFGGRLSSVLEINMKEGNMKKFHGEGSIGLISSKMTFEGPIWKDRTSFIVSARRTYIDAIVKPILLAVQKGKDPNSSAIPGYYFYDVNAKINHRFNRKHRLFASFYAGDDKFSFLYRSNYRKGNFQEKYEYKNGLQWGNITSALRWNWLISDKLFANTTLTYSKYNFGIEILDKTTVIDGDSTYIYNFGAKYFSGIEDISFKMDFDYVPLPAHYIRFGINGTYHTFKPGAINIKSSDPITAVDETFGNKHIRSGEFAAYIEDDLQIGKVFRANVGVHGSGFLVNNKFYYSVQPRIGTRVMLPKRIALKASFATMTQYIHLLTNEGIGLPTDLWIPTTDSIVPEQSWQVALGLAKTFEGLFELSIEGFYKDMRGLVSYKPGASFIEPGSNWETKVESNGLGQCYGTEVFLQRTEGKLTGWIGYTLSWSWRHFPNSNINSGRKYPYKYDRRHDIAIAAMYKFTKKISASAVWVFGTGNAVTLPIERYVMPSRQSHLFEFENYGAKNSYRMRPYHRLDLSIDLHYKKKKWEYSWSFGIYNAYSRRNPFFIFSSFDWQTQQRQFKQVSLFPFIPSVRWNFKF